MKIHRMFHEERSKEVSINSHLIYKFISRFEKFTEEILQVPSHIPIISLAILSGSTSSATYDIFSQ